MNPTNRRWWLAWAALSLLAAALLAGIEMRRQEEAFTVDGRIAHRLLSQRAVQHDAVLAMLALLPASAELPRQGLTAIFPQILRVARRRSADAWPADLPAAALAAAEAESRRQGHATTAAGGFAQGRVWLVRADDGVAHALEIDLGAPVTSPEWPASLGGETAVQLVSGSTAFALNPWQPPPGLRRFAFRKPLAADSQPYELVIVRSFGVADLPWPALLLSSLVVAVALAAAARYHAQLRARRRAEDLLRLGQATRLNALGELAAGLAHELNQPLTAVIASTQAAGRLLADDPPELATAREAMDQAVAQARRAAEVLSRLRRTVEPAGATEAMASVGLVAAARQVLDLLEPDCRARQVAVSVRGDAALTVRADPVALEQILHNLVSNALQALDQVPDTQRRLCVEVAADGDVALLRVIDSGPGVPEESLPRLFQPFFTTRPGGLGLGLSLSETLACSLGGRLEGGNGAGGGAVFTLVLPRQASA